MKPAADMIREAGYWVKKLGLQAHPEGGWFAETYRSEEKVSFPGFAAARSVSTSIYFLLEKDDFSAFHRIKSDELWHFHAGGPVTIHILQENKAPTSLTIGPDGPFQATVPANSWFAAEPVQETYTLVGCTVAPGFDFQDFELATQDQLLPLFPDAEKLIRKFTRQ